MCAKITVGAQAAPPKAVREAGGNPSGEAAGQRTPTGGGVIVEGGEAIEGAAITAARRRIDNALAVLDRRGVKFSMTSDEWMSLMRGGD